MRADDPGLGSALQEMLGPRVKRFRIAHLTAGNGVGLQLFEFAESGGRSSEVFGSIPDRPYAAAYCEDPWGNVIEINSHDYVETRTFLGAEE